MVVTNQWQLAMRCIRPCQLDFAPHTNNCRRGQHWRIRSTAHSFVCPFSMWTRRVWPVFHRRSTATPHPSVSRRRRWCIAQKLTHRISMPRCQKRMWLFSEVLRIDEAGWIGGTWECFCVQQTIRFCANESWIHMMMMLLFRFIWIVVGNQNAFVSLLPLNDVYVFVCKPYA